MRRAAGLERQLVCPPPVRGQAPRLHAATGGAGAGGHVRHAHLAVGGAGHDHAVGGGGQDASLKHISFMAGGEGEGAGAVLPAPNLEGEVVAARDQQATTGAKVDRVHAACGRGGGGWEAGGGGGRRGGGGRAGGVPSCGSASPAGRPAELQTSRAPPSTLTIMPFERLIQP